MECPVCTGTALVMAERSGIEIDYCPKCRGVWLDRGELDKIIERNASTAPAQAAPPYGPPPAQRGYADHGHGNRHPRGADADYRHRKRKGFLGELFDFD